MRLWSFFGAFARIVFLIVSFGSMTIQDNATSSGYMKMDEGGFRGKQHRWITFHTDENSDITMELSFNVPFITIPVKKTMDATKGALANINLGAILLSGVILVGTSVAAPFVSHLLAKNASKYGDGKQRSEDSVNWSDILTNTNNVFAKNSLNSTSCLERIFCWVVKSASAKVAKGSATSGEKIIDGIVTSEWFKRMIDDTILESAVRDGLSQSNCLKRYNKCKISQRKVEMVLKELLREY